MSWQYIYETETATFANGANGDAKKLRHLLASRGKKREHAPKTAHVAEKMFVFLATAASGKEASGKEASRKTASGEAALGERCQ